MNKTWITIIRIAFFGIFLFLMLIGKPFIWLALYAASLIAALFFGRIYCGFMCPINTVMAPAEFLSKKMNIQTEKTPKWLSSGVFAWVFLGISIALMLVFKKLYILISYNTNLDYCRFLITLRYKPHVFHNLICPSVLCRVCSAENRFFLKRCIKKPVLDADCAKKPALQMR
jgi:polyferredoxin